MKKNKISFVFALAIILLLLPSVAFAAVGDSFEDSACGLKFTVIAGDSTTGIYEVEVANNMYDGASYTIPETVENGGINYSVTKVGDYAFNGCNNLTSVTIGKNVKTIGEYGFAYTSLTEVEVPANVQTLEKCAFGHSFRIKKVKLNEGLKVIDTWAFGWLGIEEITIPDSVETLGYECFYTCQSLKKVNFGSGIKSMGSGIFSYTALEEITFPAGIDTIPDRAVYGCSKLTSVTMGDNIKNIGNNAFGSSGITGLVIPASVENIGNHIVSYCKNPIDITVYYDNAKTIEEGAFKNSSAEVTLSHKLIAPKSVTLNGTVLSWQAVGIAESYNVYMTNSDSGQRAIPEFVNTTQTQLDLRDYVTEVGTYTLTVVAKADGYADSDGATLNRAFGLYTVEYNMNGHAEQIQGEVLYYADKVTEPEAPTEAGYIFGGWYKEDALENAWDFAADTVEANTVLYAKWTQCTHADSENQPDCDEDAVCSVCDGTIPMLGHDFAEELTCGEDTHFYACSRCDVTEGEVPHEFTWITDKPATAEEDGLKHEECVCKAVRNEGTAIKKLSPNTGDDGMLFVWTAAATLFIITGAYAVRVKKSE